MICVRRSHFFPSCIRVPRQTFTDSLHAWQTPFEETPEPATTPQERETEVIAYRVDKIGGPPTGDSSTTGVLQTYWFFNSTNMWENFDFYDSQVKYGQEYTYKVYEYRIVQGIKYRYSNLQISRIIGHLWRKKTFGIINIGSGIKTDLRDLAILFAKKKNKKVSFGYNKPTCLVADISKLKKTGFKVRKLNLKSFTNYI